MVALITPFQDGEVDYRTLDELVDFQLESGTDAIVPMGTTGECPTLSHQEQKDVVERVVKTVAGAVPVIPERRSAWPDGPDSLGRSFTPTTCG